jgi:hypothetical protein
MVSFISYLVIHHPIVSLLIASQNNQQKITPVFPFEYTNNGKDKTYNSNKETMGLWIVNNVGCGWFITELDALWCLQQRMNCKNTISVFK